uniref:Abnormal cell migration protein 18-like fibronectin type I domain-containing protein n=1 Tax=Meloidogyne javanica TaxID=6303 RepID=A0A915LTV0_MELJA
MSSSYRRLGPRYQVLKEYVFSGQKNVRYETRPSQFLDANGNPLNAAKFTGASSGCIDIDGVNHPEGAEYERQNKHFKYRCSGKEYSEGAVYLTNHLRYQCQGGIMDVTGCYINENRDLSIGQDIVEKGMIAYHEYACGFRGTPSCTPPAIPKTPDQVPALGRGLISPGFGSFSIVETNPGSQQVKFPSSGILLTNNSPSSSHSTQLRQALPRKKETPKEGSSSVKGANENEWTVCKEDNTSGNTEELIPKSEVNPIQKEVPLIHSEDESDWERKEDFGKDWGKEVKNLKISDKIKCDSDDDWDNEECVLKEKRVTDMNDKDLDWEKKPGRYADAFGILLTNNSPSSSNSPQLKHDLVHGKKETFNEGNSIHLIHSEDESDWEHKEDYGMDWGKGLKNIEISEKIKCDSDSEWDNEECIPVNENLKQKAEEEKVTNINDSDLDWKDKADHKLDWKIEKENAVQTKGDIKCDSAKNFGNAWDEECKIKNFVNINSERNRLNNHNAMDNQTENKLKIEEKNKVKKKTKKGVSNDADMDWEQKADLIDQIDWKNKFN